MLKTLEKGMFSSLHGPQKTGSLFCSAQLQLTHHPGSISFPALLSNTMPHYLKLIQGREVDSEAIEKGRN